VQEIAEKPFTILKILSKSAVSSFFNTPQS